ncbi:MAG: DNA-directed RNA polymerase subunit K [Candidatus Bathyarchaeia archaeon]
MARRSRAANSKTSSTISLHIGPRKLTRFEKARIIGARALQISMGAPILIEVPPNIKTPMEIALLELEEGVLPMSIRRRLPDGTSQNIPVKLLLEGEEEPE